MKRPPLPVAVLVLALAACAPAPGAWPSLARVPGAPAAPCGGAADSTPTAPDGARPCVAAPPTSVPTPATKPGGETAAPAAAPTAVDIAALEQRFAAARQAWSDQLAETETAVASAARGNAGETTWAGAELALSRLERRAAPFAEIADTLAGAEPAARVTALREAAMAARDEHLRVFGRLRSALRH